MILLGHILDGLVLVYNLYKRMKIAPLKPSLDALRKSLKGIHESLPLTFRVDYRKKRLKTRENDLALLEIPLQNALLRQTKESISVMAEIYQSLRNLKGYHPTVFALAKILGTHPELCQYFFRELAKNEEKIALLEIILSPKERYLLPLEYASLKISREGFLEESCLCVKDALVSRPHCVLIREKNSLTVEDLGSRNGTYVNTTMTREKRTLRDGDEIRVGGVRMRLNLMQPNSIVETFETKILAMALNEPFFSYQTVLWILFLLIVASFVILFYNVV